MVAKALGNEIVVDEKFVNAPEEKRAERRVVDMGVDVVDGGACDDLADGEFDFLGLEGAALGSGVGSRHGEYLSDRRR